MRTTTEPHLEQIDFQELFCLQQGRHTYETHMKRRQSRQQANQGFVFAGNVDNCRVEDVVARLQENYAEVKALTGRAFDGTRMHSLSGIYVRDPRITPELVTAVVVERDKRLVCPHGYC